MMQLEERFYSLDELAKAIERTRDSHFADRAKRDLTKWGYEYTWLNRRGVTIINKPSTPRARLIELMGRKFGLDIQVDVYAFACFLFLMLTDTSFTSMPWAERAYTLWEQYDLDISEKTLRNWASTLLANKQLHKETTERQYWRTSKCDGYTFREPISWDDPDYIRYKSRQKMYIEQCLKKGQTKSQAWGNAFKQLWKDFECCYYACPRFTFNMIADEINELIELAAEVCADA